MAIWGIASLSTVWRRVLVRLVGDEIVRIARDLGVRPRPIFAGWRVEAGPVRVDWRGGFTGETTRIRFGKRAKVRADGALDAARVHASLDELRAKEPGQESGGAR